VSVAAIVPMASQAAGTIRRRRERAQRRHPARHAMTLAREIALESDRTEANPLCPGRPPSASKCHAGRRSRRPAHAGGVFGRKGLERRASSAIVLMFAVRTAGSDQANGAPASAWFFRGRKGAEGPGRLRKHGATARGDDASRCARCSDWAGPRHRCALGAPMRKALRTRVRRDAIRTSALAKAFGTAVRANPPGPRRNLVKRAAPAAMPEAEKLPPVTRERNPCAHGRINDEAG
jgi:hypothetical protein